MMSIFQSIDDSLSIFELMAPFMFFGAGLLFFYLYLAPYIKLKFGKKYLPVGAKILKSYVHEYYLTTSGRSSLLYKPVIEYQYEINGEKYISTKLFITTKSYSSSIKYHAETFQNKYTEGSIVTAYVHPVKSEKAYLEEIIPLNTFLIGFSVLFTLIGVIIYIIKH